MAADSLGVVFFTGLTAGGLSCLAVQGGLLARIGPERPDRRRHRRHEQPWHLAYSLPHPGTYGGRYDGQIYRNEVRNQL